MQLSNYIDVGYIVIGFVNIFSLLYTEGKLSFNSEIIFIVTIFLTVAKKFRTMKSQKRFSTIVTMLANVFVDLTNFLIFFLILLINFSLVF